MLGTGSRGFLWQRADDDVEDDGYSVTSSQMFNDGEVKDDDLAHALFCTS